MASSSRSAQLGLWQEIVSKPHQSTELANGYSDFIRKRFDELDSEGFIWSRESMLDVFLQLGVSEKPHDSGSSVDDVTKSCVLRGVTNSSDEVEEVVRNDEMQRTTRPLGLMDLPMEIFQMILETLNCLAVFEADELVRKRYPGVVEISCPGGEPPYMSYLYRTSPVLNVTQTFALTSREIYKRCEPRLWRHLSFPSAWPAPINLWTEDILLKQGSHARSLSLDLSKNCSKRPGEFAQYDHFYDNLFLEHKSSAEGISPKNVKALINRCPNLLELDIYCEYGDIYYGDGTERFLLELIPLVSSLKQLRHFGLFYDQCKTIMKEFPSKAVSSLPGLESLVIQVPVASKDQQTLCDDSFGYNLSKLKHLSHLNLWHNQDINQSWCLYKWPRTIVDLSICNCGDLSPTSAYQIIHHIAPYLTSLTLYFAYQEGDDSGEIKPSQDSESRLSLPFLTDLHLETQIAHSLTSFQDCKSLQHLEWTCRTLEHFRTLKTILLKATWPQLKTLEVKTFHLRNPEFGLQRPEIEDHIASLEKCCEEIKVKAIIYRPWDD